jgi:uncharacterized membrane protein YGL010W
MNNTVRIVVASLLAVLGLLYMVTAGLMFGIAAGALFVFLVMSLDYKAMFAWVAERNKS